MPAKRDNTFIVSLLPVLSSAMTVDEERTTRYGADRDSVTCLLCLRFRRAPKAAAKAKA
jgi:hypothetical protein